jgi:hypothetical protein
MRTQTGTYRTYKDMLIALPKIGKLQILELSHKNKWGAYYIKCQCDCGNITTTDFSSLNKIKVKSCGCLQKNAVKITGLNNVKYTINTKKLIDNDITAYMMGLYGADGSNEKGAITLGLQSIDVDILNAIKQYLEYTGPLYKTKNSHKLVISNQYFRMFCEKHGILKNKTYTYTVPEIYKMNLHYWRGMLDGDGCIYKYNDLSYGVTLVGTESVILAFETFVKGFVQNIKAKPFKLKNCKNAYTYCVSGKNSIILLNELYNCMNINDLSIKRKKDKFYKFK